MQYLTNHLRDSEILAKTKAWQKPKLGKTSHLNADLDSTLASTLKSHKRVGLGLEGRSTESIQRKRNSIDRGHQLYRSE